jgi:predicted ATP-dependent endonuclease of OLD family
MGVRMKLHLSNLGPIKHGEVELGDITLFVGKPNTGKSLAMKALFNSLYCPDDLIELRGDPLEVRDNSFIQRFTIDWEKTKENYRNFIRESLPEGEFKLEPINVLDFLLTQKLSYEKKFTAVSLPPMYFPEKCSNKDIERLRSSLSNAVYEISVNGDEGEVKVDANISGVKQSCLKDGRTLSSLSTAFMEIAKERVNSQYSKGFNDALWEIGIFGITYITFSTRFATLQNLLFQGEINKTFGLNKYEPIIYDIIKPLLKGQLKYINGELVYEEEGKTIPWEDVPASVLEIVSFLLSTKRRSLILYEEPENHLHEELQLLMGVVLYALSSFSHIVISTHSQTILYTIAHLSILKPTKEELKDLFEDLKVRDYEALVEAVEEANQKEVKVKIYHFTERGEIKEVSIDEAVKGMPGTIDVLEKEFKWFSSLHSKRLF